MQEGPERSYCERPLPLCRAHPMTVAMRGSLSRPQRSLHHESRIARILQFAGAAAMDSN